jgi:hypothetical protein
MLAARDRRLEVLGEPAVGVQVAKLTSLPVAGAVRRQLRREADRDPRDQHLDNVAVRVSTTTSSSAYSLGAETGSELE